MGRMSPPDGHPRPSQVTVAGWGVLVAAVLLLAGVFDGMSNLYSVETRDRVTEELTTGSAKGFGIGVDDALSLIRWGLFVSGAAAAAAAILGFFVLRRNKGARIGLSVAAVPIVLTALVSGSFVSMFIGAATAILWTRPARDWFAGRPITPSAREVRQREQPQSQSQPPAVVGWVPPQEPGSPSAPPPPTIGWGQAPGQPPSQPPYPSPYGQPPDVRGQVQLPPRSPRPAQVRTACILAWVFSGVTALGYLALLIAIAVDSGWVMDRVKESPGWDPSYDDDVVLTGAVIMGVLFLLWCVAAAVVALFAWRGAYWAWILLTISTGLAALVSVIAFPLSLIHLAALAAAFGLLLRKTTRDWFAQP